MGNFAENLNLGNRFRPAPLFWEFPLGENILVDTATIYQNESAKSKLYKRWEIFKAIHYSYEKPNDIELRSSKIQASCHYHCDQYHL